MLLLWSSPPIIPGEHPIILQKPAVVWPGPPIILYKDGQWYEQNTRRIEDEYIVSVLKDSIIQ